MSFDHHRYQPTPAVELPSRTWPTRSLTKAPRWVSVDLRDGNQALIEPMGSERKLELFQLLVALGLREIEVGFPAASETDFEFVRRLIDEDRIPKGVTIQVLVQAREALIERTFEAIRGARRAIVHVYNSTSTLQRRVVFGMSQAAVRELAEQGVRWVRERARRCPETEIVLEYSPESFTGTELPYALEVCEAVMDVWGPTEQAPIILNLPATVEMATPNVYADQIEWMACHLSRRSRALISLHAHNDRGTAVAASELAMLAGADRVEGTLFGNGERTGNADLVTLAMNLYVQGIDPELDLSRMPEIVRTYERCTKMTVHPRHPYAGELVFTAFSGSHQDAIRKGLVALAEPGGRTWEVPYLPIDPADVGRLYEPLVRINSQSGKGGVAYVLERARGYRIPRGLSVEFSQLIQQKTDASGTEMSAAEVVELFEQTYLGESPALSLKDFELRHPASDRVGLTAHIQTPSGTRTIEAHGKGPVEAFLQGVNQSFGVAVHCVDFQEHALGVGDDAEAVAYVELRQGERVSLGVGKAQDILSASLRAVLAGVGRLMGE